MQIDGFKKIQLPELKKPKTGGLMDAIKKGAESVIKQSAEAAIGGQAAVAGQAIGQAIKKIADADNTVKAKGPAATSKLELGNVPKASQQAIDGAEAVVQTIPIGYRTRTASSGNGELTSV